MASSEEYSRSQAQVVHSREDKPASSPVQAKIFLRIETRGSLAESIVRLDPDRPGTSGSYSTQPHTGITSTTKGTRIKYGRGKHATTELVPQPSDDPQDPLNWQTWRKELSLYALLVTVALSSVMKTALISVNDILAQELGTSYVAVTALTGLPLILSSGTGLASLVASKIWGRRPVYLVSMILIFIGLVWNSKITSSYGQFMAARVFQGLGWGAFDTVVVTSITDIYFEHERATKIATYRTILTATTWGSPLIGAVVSQNKLGVKLQFEILAIFQVVSIPLLVFGAPETIYNRTAVTEKLTSTPGWSPSTGWASLGLKSSSRFQRLPAWARGRGMTADRVIQYIREVAPPKPYAGSASTGVMKTTLLFQILRAVITPTAGLAFLASFLPFSLLWGLSSSLSGLFARSPSDLLPTSVGLLLAFPFVLSSATVVVFSLWPAWSQTGTVFRLQSTHLLALASGAMLSFIGILGFGLYVSSHSGSPATANGLRFPAVSFLLGLLAAGAYVLAAPTGPLINRSAQFTSPNLRVSLRTIAEMDAAVTFWRTLFAGVFVIGIPAATVASADALKTTGIAVSVIQMFVAGAVGGVWYLWDDGLRRLDGQVLGYIDLSFVKARGSFFETDD
ncbi:MFS general substrate transporter [Cryphonectria parasitica EP155]|uniref:MFS general substrate transporter n=1 Tax=Cryphonectria parasitica (strain ATCC 38755 / EP155) TaxID=660469 RepID=A0A9P5CR73_CRYP1|nr:MFS general substrate transporter [Cryphonectria parasitica EP155]KAF3766971.1 MFS general substrate transporter [Cryphonectria parasitica EP155]